MNLITGLLVAMTITGTTEPYDFDTLWNYDEPAATEAKFRALLPDAETSGDPAYHAELLTQLARTSGLQQQFDSAHAMLDQVEAMLDEAGDRARIRYLLERGRTFRSSGQMERATPLFEEAWSRATTGAFDFHAVDAAHMLGIVMPGLEGMEWNRKAITHAKGSVDPRARNWLGSLFNNTGWTYFDAEQFEQALEMFNDAVTFRTEQEKPKEILIARWCVAKTERAMGRIEAALATQYELVEAWATLGEPDGYVYEEIAECLLLKDRPEEAAPYFKRAYDLLSKDIWIRRDEPDRLKRLQELGGMN